MALHLCRRTYLPERNSRDGPTAFIDILSHIAAFPEDAVEKLGLGAVREKPQEEGAGIMGPVAPRIFFTEKELELASSSSLQCRTPQYCA